MSWKAHFHGGPANGQHFTVQAEPAPLVTMEDMFLDEDDGDLIWQVFTYLRTKLTAQTAVYHLHAVGSARRKESQDSRNLC